MARNQVINCLHGNLPDRTDVSVVQVVYDSTLACSSGPQEQNSVTLVILLKCHVIVRILNTFSVVRIIFKNSTPGNSTTLKILRRLIDQSFQFNTWLQNSL